LAPDADGFLDVVYAPTGFMLIRREVFLALMERFPALHCQPRLTGRAEHDSGEMARFHYAFFDTMIDPQTREYLSEDYAFCQRIKEIGITPTIDTRSNFTHQGVAIFRGDVTRSLAMQRSVVHQDAEVSD
jgi:hypothetical protein